MLLAMAPELLFRIFKALATVLTVPQLKNVDEASDQLDRLFPPTIRRRSPVPTLHTMRGVQTMCSKLAPIEQTGYCVLHSGLWGDVMSRQTNATDSNVNPMPKGEIQALTTYLSPDAR